MTTDRVDAYPERSGIDSTDPDLIQKHLDQAYTAHFTITRAGDPAGGCSCAHTRLDVGSFAIEEIRHDGDVMLRADRVPSAVALFVERGRAEVEHGRLTGSAGPGEWLLASTGIGAVRIRLIDTQLRSVVVARTLLAEVAAIDTVAESVPRFTGLTPGSVPAGRTLEATERFLNRILTASEPPANRMLLTSAGRMLAGAMLATFPNDLPAEHAPDDAGDTHPALLRQAIGFIQDNAARDIGIGDVASALYLSPRTVQYMFRRHLDTTPTAYLREVRLARAREELIASDRSITTVAATAARWGFAHTGRFAVIYRRAFGESPHETLRR
jgi:AraC-like DNA-binding protein